MRLFICEYEPKHASDWDNFVNRSIQGAFLHTRKFLSYHREKFVDKSSSTTENSRIMGLFPAAIDPTNDSSIISHPGITYGGIIDAVRFIGPKMQNVIQNIILFLQVKISKRNYKADSINIP